MKTHGNCTNHKYRSASTVVRSIGYVNIEICNNCLSVVVFQKRDTDNTLTETEIEMENSAYTYVK